ncbi:mucosa-associated lymphoid tissue lymphoma translocation protein 1 homolog [Lingula anatina]|uniref:Mucosa-associated lymphoid tissue lymphoma translocation protein 1 homolog n=1 Tax=Lingula anatina TaxID=7574 RepID=A0A1S3H049_LINAN|nr:mucosa-associated lymphoid tissue lymphoma translocation protein 1 homolog [Lingula anatina]|eukprot:XP_013379500.1 mucosa-associated lymphoid tissue lymphoma translocation protein 1 homolog [Lingula anatina]
MFKSEDRTYLIKKDTNICDIDFLILKKLFNYLDASPSSTQGWRDLVAAIPDSPFRPEEVEQIAMCIHSHQSPSQKLLQRLGTRGRTVEQLVSYLWAMKNEKCLELLIAHEPVKICKEPVASVVLEEGDTLTLECEATGFPFPRYQWFNGQAEVLSGSESLLCIPAIKLRDKGRYVCRVHNRGNEGVCFSKPAMVQVKPCNYNQDQGCENLYSRTPTESYVTPLHPNAPYIARQPELNDNRIIAGKPFEIVCDASGQSPLKYQWYRNGQPLHVETGMRFYCSGASTDHSGIYQCVVSNRYGEARSKEVQVQVELAYGSQPVPISPTITKSPKACKLEEGGTTVLNCEAIGMEPIAFQWYKDGKPIEGHAGPRLELNNVTVDDKGIYQCSVSNRHGKALSKVAKVEVFCSDNREFTATDKVVLLIGNHHYRCEKNLIAPPNDIRDLQNLFEEMNFKVVSLINLTKEQILNAVDEFCKLLFKGVYGVFYFAGHGFEKQGQCYLVPSDASTGYGANDCVCAEYVLKKMQEMNPALAVMMLDICRKENVHATESVEIYKPAVRGNMVFAYATSFSMEAYEEEPLMPVDTSLCSVNGIFVKHLKKLIKQKKMVSTMFQEVAQAVNKDALAKEVQFPEVRTNLNEARSFTDPIDFRGSTQRFDKNLLRWQQSWECPSSTTYRSPESNIIVKLDFEAAFCNQLEVHTTVLDEAACSNVAAWVEHLVDAYSTQNRCKKSCKSSRPYIAKSEFNDIQNLRGPLHAVLFLQYKVYEESHTEKAHIELGEPLVVPLLLSRPRVLANQRVPMEQEEVIYHVNR